VGGAPLAGQAHETAPTLKGQVKEVVNRYAALEIEEALFGERSAA
jgi:hypothetical protein